LKEKGPKRTLRKSDPFLPEPLSILVLFFFRRFFFSPEKKKRQKNNL
jgi:hypothetical protein